MNLTRRYKERKKEREESVRNRRRRKEAKRWGKTKSQLLSVGSEL